ncbi:hypothetical protein [Nitrosomonas sp.]|uniref:hypothetical protein n=1 Tax=Nitrosomonas sp. TaxID=42353 RepID=UPI0025FE3482|nr:hypothetical protein [Nitrosomonas sp.]MCC6915907.1 hypothetical protein [Nitrosomonas sp.]
MKHITSTIFIAALAGLLTSVFSFPDFRDSSLPQPQPVQIAAAGAETRSQSPAPPAAQGNEMQDERVEFEEQAERREFGDETDQEEFREQAIRREFGGQTKFTEPVPAAENHDH